MSVLVLSDQEFDAISRPADETNAPRAPLTPYGESLVKNLRGIYERLWVNGKGLTDSEAEWLIRAVAAFRGDPPIPERRENDE